ncbi:MAG: YhgE/Pip family protein, partial [Pseudobutyrivibrio sp.]|nr:YhgE/Pip family protein [Pseudobutyrivibrio sp.]
MKNIIKIIESDIKRLSTNVVAMVVIIGLTVIPCLYAWFNILSNWDPYGPDATQHLQVAVVSADQGIMIGSAEVNVGEIIISRLKANNTIGWVFTDKVEDAVGGVYSGDYYAALVIDEQFSSNMISFLGGNIENPKITYYENEKKNAIAPKITAKVKTTIEREVDHAFVGTVAEVLLKAGEYFANVDEQGNITGKGIEKLERLDSDLNGVIVILDSYIALMDSTEEISKAGEAVANTAKSITKTAEAMADNAEAQNPNVKQDVQKAKNKTDEAVYKINDKLDDVDASIGKIKDTVSNVGDNQDPVGPKLQTVYNVFSSAWNGENGNDGIYSYVTTGVYSIFVPERAKVAAGEINNMLPTLGADIQALINAEQASAASTKELKEKIEDDTNAILRQSKTIR